MVSADISHWGRPCTPTGGMMGSHASRTSVYGMAGALAGLGPGLGPGWRNPLRRLAACFAAERERWILWAPVGIGLGVVGYFLLPTEPPSWIGTLAAALLMVAAAVLR